MKVKLNCVVETTVDLSGVSQAYKWLAIDQDGLIFVYTHKPTPVVDTWVVSPNVLSEVFERVGDIGYSGIVDWKETLMEINWPEPDPEPEPLPIGAIVVWDVSKTTNEFSSGYETGTVTSIIADSLYKYLCAKIYKCSNEVHGHYVSEDAIIAAYDAETGEQLRGNDGQESLD